MVAKLEYVNGLKFCSKCKLELALDNFNFHKSGYRIGKPLSKCKPCSSKSGMLWAKNNPEKTSSISARSYRNNIHKRLTDEERAKRNIWSKLWAKNNPDKCREITRRKKAIKLSAMPKWASKDSISIIYSKVVKLSKNLNQNFHVDHIVPLVSNYVCGLHTESNLQALIFDENIKKSNKFWPGMPVIDTELKLLMKNYNNGTN
jgi:dimeric dUTPase (all-alpha-NTP-PPase superfamily)